MSIKYNGITVETSGVRTIAGGGTNANTATGALANLGGYPASNPNGYITGIDTSNFYTRNNPSGYISGDLSTLYPRSNPSGYISGDLSLLYSSSNPSGFISGVSQFNYISGDLIGNLLSPSLGYIQGNPISAASPSGGQTLQWNGTTWAPGSIPNGGNGGGGKVYYFDFANTTGIAPTGGLPASGDHGISLLGRSYEIGSGQAISNDLDPRFTDKLLCSFVTASGDPGVSNIPAGLWDFNIWASVNSANTTQSSMKVVVNIYNPLNSTYRYLASSDEVYLYEADTVAQYILNATVPQTGIASHERIYIGLYGKKYTTNDRRITVYFDSYRPSHVHTTLPSVAGNGIVKVINGVFQTPASKIIDNDIDADAAIQQSKIQNLTGDLAALYPRSNPSGYISGDLSTLYPRSNPSGFISGVPNSVYTTGNQTISGIKTFKEGLEVGQILNVSTLYIMSGAVGVNNENPQASLDVSGLAIFSQRPAVNGTGLMITGDDIGFNTIIFYHSPSSSIASGLLYFSNLQLPPSSDIANRRVTIMEKIVAKKAAWSAYCATTGNPADVDYTGYFINNTKSTTGIISSSIKVSSSSGLFNYAGNISPEVQVDAGDLVSIGINAPDSTIAPVNFQNSVDIYFYKK
jgi:hypothetical protein